MRHGARDACGVMALPGLTCVSLRKAECGFTPPSPNCGRRRACGWELLEVVDDRANVANSSAYSLREKIKALVYISLCRLTRFCGVSDINPCLLKVKITIACCM